ncbi:MAG TPA: tyrosine-protein phosphatase, partial [Chloroflexota bacterium]
NQRHLPWDACFNIRDVGGYAAAPGRRTRWRALLRGDNLAWLRPSGREALIDYGVRTIIDLRHPREIARAAHPFASETPRRGGPAYLNLPVSDWTDASLRARIESAGTNEEIYRIVLGRARLQIGRTMRAIADAPDGPVLVHCNAGKDRTGMIAALALALAGVPAPTIAQDYALSGPLLKPYYAAVVKEVPTDPESLTRLAERMACRPEAMLAMLAELETEHGGVEAYLETAGLQAAEIERLRVRLTEQVEG